MNNRTGLAVFDNQKSTVEVCALHTHTHTQKTAYPTEIMPMQDNIN